MCVFLHNRGSVCPYFLLDDKYAHLLTPTFALAGLLPDSPSYENMPQEALDALIAEMENDIRAADRDMQEIESLQRRGITGAGKLASTCSTRPHRAQNDLDLFSGYEPLEPRLEALMAAHDEDLAQAANLEQRIASLMERHATQVGV